VAHFTAEAKYRDDREERDELAQLAAMKLHLDRV
jgi:hypothetical protein